MYELDALLYVDPCELIEDYGVEKLVGHNKRSGGTRRRLSKDNALTNGLHKPLNPFRQMGFP